MWTEKSEHLPGSIDENDEAKSVDFDQDLNYVNSNQTLLVKVKSLQSVYKLHMI